MLMIVSFKDKRTEKIAGGSSLKGFQSDMLDRTINKLVMLDGAVTLEDLRSPPGNRLEALAGNRQGQHSIRINDQWRICFTWTSKGPENVEIVDYH
jgi:toxin HigB-1